MTPIKPALPLHFPLIKRTATPDVIPESKNQVNDASSSKLVEEEETSVPSAAERVSEEITAVPSSNTEKPKTSTSPSKKESQSAGKKKAKDVHKHQSEETSTTVTPAASRNVSGASFQPPQKTPKKEASKTSDETTKKPGVTTSEPKSEKKTGSSCKRQAPGKLDILAATASKDEEKKPRKPVTVSVPPTPATASTGSPVKKPASKIIRVVQTPKAETPPPLSATSAASVVAPPLPGKLRSRQASIASVNMPGTPLSNEISDAASITSASISRANSPPPGGKGKAASKIKTKNQAKKERQERHKQQTAEKIEEAVAVDDVVHEPILGRKKKTRKPAKTPSLPTPRPDSQPASPAIKEEEAKKSKAESSSKQAARPASPPVKASSSEEKIADGQSTKTSNISPASIISSMEAEIINSAFFKAIAAMLPKGEFTAADISNLERRIQVAQSDLEKIAKNIPIHLGGEDDRISSRCLVTPEGLLWGMPADIEARYLDLSARTRAATGPTKYRHISKRAQHHEAHNKPSTPVSLPSFAASLRSASTAHLPFKPSSPFDDSLRRPFVDDAASYVDQWVIPSDSLPPSNSRGGNTTPVQQNPNAQTTAGIPGSALPLEATLDLLDGYITRASGASSTAARGGAAPGARVGEDALAALMSGDSEAIAAAGFKMGQSYEELERAFVESRRETERLEKSMNALLKKNRKVLAGL